MGAADGIPRITSALKSLDDELARSTELWHERAAAARDAEKAWEKSHGNDAAEYAMTHGHASEVPSHEEKASSGLNPLSEDVLDAQGFTKGSYQSGGANVTAYDISVAASFEDLASRIGNVDSYVATVFRTVAKFIRDGRMGGNTAKVYAEGLLANYSAGFRDEAADPHNSPTMRALDSELQRFISTGWLNTQRT